MGSAFFDSTIENCIEKWQIKDTEEQYVKNFKQKVGRFLGQAQFKENPEIGELLLQLLNHYDYYSKDKVEFIFKDFYENFLKKRISESSSIYVPIISVGDKTKINSSFFYLEKFLDVNNLSNDHALNIDSLRSIIEIKNGKKELNYANEQVNYYQQKELGRAVIQPEELQLKKIYNKLRYIKTVILIDDFSGSGDTIKNFLKNMAEVINNKKVIIFIVDITEEAKEVILTSFKEYGYLDTAVHHSNIRKKCFDEDYLDDKYNYKEMLKKFEETVLFSNHPLGYKDSQALVTFYRNTPNNTLSSYWLNEQNSWKPLFKRENNAVDFFGDKFYEKQGQNIIYNLAKLGVEDYDLKDLIYLMYIKEKDNISEDFEIKNILGYNDNQLLEHKNLLRQRKLISDEHCISEEGLMKIKDLKLEKISFSFLLEKNEMEISSDALSINDDYIPSKFGN